MLTITSLYQDFTLDMYDPAQNCHRKQNLQIDLHALLTGAHLGEEVLLGISLLFLSDSCDGGGITAGLDPGEGSPGNLFDDGSSGETRKRYSKENICHQNPQC